MTDPKKTKFSTNWSLINSVIQTLSLLVLVATLFTSISTIKEMRTDRNETYKAFLVANPVQEAMATSADSQYSVLSALFYSGNTDGIYIKGHALPSDSTDEADKYVYRIIPFSDMFSSQSFTQIAFANIGSGIASNVRFSWNAENTQNLYDLLLEADTEASSHHMIKEKDFLYDPTSDQLKDIVNLNQVIPPVNLFNSNPPDYKYTYMLSDAAETYLISLPEVYSLLFSEILLHNSIAKPSVELQIEFSDTQGVEYYENITLTASNPTPISLLGKTVANGSGDVGGILYTITLNCDTPIQKQP